MKCENKVCLHTAETGSKFCAEHGAKPPAVITGVSEPQVIAFAEVPKSARFNEQAAKLVKKVRALQTGSALKMETKYYAVATLNIAKKYALEENLRIGVRVCGEVAYVWRLTEQEIAAVETKGARLAAGRAKKKGK